MGLYQTHLSDIVLFLSAKLDWNKGQAVFRASVSLTLNHKLSMGRNGLVCLICGVTAVGSHVITCSQDQDQLSSHTPIKGCLLQCICHLLPILKQEGVILHIEVYVLWAC